MNKFIQLKISLKEIEPLIWRRFAVRDSISFHQLHEIIQKVMGWENYHLYEFKIDNEVLGQIDDDALDSNPDLKDSEKIKLFKYLNKEGKKFVYYYDFGDSWAHDIKVEKILEDYVNNPICIEGERACPPEDCGGTGGYERLLVLLKTGKDPEGGNAKELKNWLGNWQPEKFDINQINKSLKNGRKRKN